MAVTTESIPDICERAHAAALRLAGAGTEAKDDALRRAATLLRGRIDEILAANAADVEAGREAGLDPASEPTEVARSVALSQLRPPRARKARRSRPPSIGKAGRRFRRP